MTEPFVVADADPFPLASLVALGGRSIADESATAAISARVQAADGLEAMRSVHLPLVDAIEPLHHLARLASFAGSAPPDPPEGQNS